MRESDIRTEFERWASAGTRPYFYSLKQAANDDYISPYTHETWCAFREGYLAAVRAKSKQIKEKQP